MNTLYGITIPTRQNTPFNVPHSLLFSSSNTHDPKDGYGVANQETSPVVTFGASEAKEVLDLSVVLEGLEMVKVSEVVEVSGMVEVSGDIVLDFLLLSPA